MSPRHGREDPGLTERLRAQLAQVTAERDRLQQHLDARAELDRMLMVAPAANGDTGPLPAARAQGPRAAGHRKERGHLWLVKLLIPAALLGRLAVKGSAARKITGVAMAAMVSVPAVTVGTQVMRDTPDQAVATPAPAAVTAPVTPAPPAAVTRPRRRHRKPAPVSVPPPVTVTRPSRPPAPSPPSLPPSTPLISVPAALDLGVYVAGQIVISNPQDQAVPWSVTCGQDGSITPSQGVLEPGQQGVQLQVQADPADGASGAVCTFEPGSEKLVVTWAGAGSPSSAAS